MPATKAKTVRFEKVSEGFYRDTTGRFDLFLGRNACWTAIDGEAGKRFVAGDCAKCEMWCQEQLEASRGNP